VLQIGHNQGELTVKINGTTFKTKKVAKRDMLFAKFVDRTVFLAYVEQDSIGTKLGWYFVVESEAIRSFSSSAYRFSLPQLKRQAYFETPEAALEQALALTSDPFKS